MNGLMLQIGDDGIAREYSTKYDVSIHCESEEEMKKVEDMLRNYPRWIPVTEKLPEKNGSYLCSVDDESVNIGSKQFVTTLDYGDAAKNAKEHFKSCVFENGKAFGEDWSRPDDKPYSEIDNVVRVIAWMPIPEPYREEES